MKVVVQKREEKRPLEEQRGSAVAKVLLSLNIIPDIFSSDEDARADQLFVGDTVCVKPGYMEHPAFLRKTTMKTESLLSSDELEKYKIGIVTSLLRGDRVEIRTATVANQGEILSVLASSVIKLSDYPCEQVQSKRQFYPHNKLRGNTVSCASLPAPLNTTSVGTRLEKNKCSLSTEALKGSYQFHHPVEAKLILHGMTQASRSSTGVWRKSRSSPRVSLDAETNPNKNTTLRDDVKPLASQRRPKLKSKFFKDSFKNKEVFTVGSMKMPKFDYPKPKSMKKGKHKKYRKRSVTQQSYGTPIEIVGDLEHIKRDRRSILKSIYGKYTPDNLNEHRNNERSSLDMIECREDMNTQNIINPVQPAGDTAPVKKCSFISSRYNDRLDADDYPNLSGKGLRSRFLNARTRYFEVNARRNKVLS